MTGGYAAQYQWRVIQQFLPVEYRLGPSAEPVEEWWSWRGHTIHLDTYRNPGAPAKVLLLHGVGTNGRQMTTVLGAPLARRGLETIAIDLPGYGVTQVAEGADVTYEDWVQATVDLIAHERSGDDRPIVLCGLSAGGMLAYHAAAIDGRIAGIVGTTFLDQRVRRVADETAHDVAMSRIGGALATLAAHTPLGGLRLPMRVASKMRALVNDPAALQACLRDRTSAGNALSLRFLSSYLHYGPAVEPEDFDVCPVLLAQPGADRWTPRHLSDLFLDRLHLVPVEAVVLQNAGHYPLEQPGLQQLADAVESFVRRVAAG